VDQVGVERAVYAAQVRALYQQAPIVLAVNLVNAALVAAVLAPEKGAWNWAAWFALIATLTAARAVWWRRYRVSAPPPETARRWALLATLGSALSGLLWGLGGALLFPGNIVEQIFLAFVIGGMCAGALVSLGAHLPSFLAYLLLSVLPIAGRYLLEGTALGAVMAAMIVVFAMALAAAAYNFSRSVAEGFRLRLELTQRTDELMAANARLQEEITERRAAEDRLRQAQKMEAVGQLTGGIAHDFNNLLTAVIGHLEMAQALTSGGTRLAGLLQSALDAAERGATLTQRLLAFARKQRLNPKVIDIRALVDDLQRLLTQTLGPAVRLVIEPEPGLWPARVDRNQLELAILNLAINGRDAMPEGGTLRIGLANRLADVERLADLAPGDYVVVSVSDTGTGMDAATLDRVFEPFFTTKEVGRGSGLGLPMVQGFAAQSGGAVHIESALGRGTLVELWLPRAHSSAAPDGAMPEAGAASPPGAARILVCDDDPGVRGFVSTFLREGGYTVWEANDPGLALQILERERPIDLFLVDYAMPDMNGDETIALARRHQPGLKVLLMTGHAEALRAGGIADVPLLPKPFKPAELRKRVAEALESDGAVR
jgi:signal transduction histidine kinase